MMAMPRWMMEQFATHWRGFVLASLVPAAAFCGLLVFANLLEAQPDGLVGEAAKAQRKDVLGYAIYAVILLFAGAHGLVWTLSRLTVGFDKGFQHAAERYSCALGWRPVRSLALTFCWLLFAIMAFVAVGMALSLFAYSNPGELISSTGEQASALADGTREAVERGQLTQNVTQADFNPVALRAAQVAAAAFAIWIFLKAMIAVPLRVMGKPVNLLSVQDATAGWRGIRLTLWVMLLGASGYALYVLVGQSLPDMVRFALQVVMFVVAVWLMGGMLAWHARKSVA